MESQVYPWLNTFLSYFKTIKTYDTEIESFRSSLSSIPEFTPLSLFTYLDKNLKSFLSLNDFKSFLSSENVAFDEIKLRKLIHNFDKDGDFSLNLKEFTYLIQSKRKKIKNEYFPNCKLEINQEIKNDLKTIIEKEMDLIKELNDIAKEIINSKIFSTYEAFTLIVGKENYITKKNFGKFLNDNYMEISEEDVEQIMFRIDADDDDKISYEEFKEIFFTLNGDNSYNNKNNTNNEIANKYMNIEEENLNNNYENIEERNQDNNLNNDDNYNIKNDEEDNKNIGEEYNKNVEEEDNKNIEEDNNINPNKKKKKTTKKVILKPQLKSNLNNDSESNLLHSRKPLIKEEEQYENNYIKRGKCANCGVPKKDITETAKYNIVPEIDSNINNLNNNFEEEKISNINLRGKNNNNNTNLFNPKNENNKEHKSGNCKACLYTAKNIFSDLRSKNNINSAFISNDYNNLNKNEENKKEEENIEIEKDINSNLEENKEDNNEDNEYDIYKNKDELLKKYGIISDYSNKNLENNIDVSNFNFSTQKKYTYSLEISNNNENEDNINNSPQEKENMNILLKSKNKNPLSNNNNLIETNYSSNELSISPRFNIIPKNDINEKKKLLFKLFINFIEKETEVRKIKESLSSCQEANPQNIFDLFNINQSNKISSSDILKTLNSLASNDAINKDDIKYIFKKYNKTSSNGFTFYELKNILFSDKNILNNDEINLEEKTKSIIFEFFKEVIEGEKEIENSRIMLNEATNNIYYDLFESIKKGNKLGIEKDDIETFMKENEYDVKEEELNIIMEKMDKNRDGLIDYSEFIDEIKPMNFC